ncbi:MAG: AMP-binding protein [Lachnospiraceae bacterium]|nr:AMP-binding protein [Lachnospiraceae bacterium]
MKTIREMLDRSFMLYGKEPAIRYLNKKEVCELHYADIEQKVKAIRAALHAKGYEGKQISLIGESSPEWVETFFGITTGRSAAVPLDVMLPPMEFIDLINRSDSEALFVSPSFEKVLDLIRSSCPKLRDIVLLTPEGIAGFTDGFTEVQDREYCPAASDLAVIIFTSGTTGKSKGVMLSHENLVSNVENVEVEAGPGTTMLSVLPIHHAYCLTCDWIEGFYHGVTVMINDSLLHMAKNMKRFNPDIMLMVPLMIESIGKKIAQAGQGGLPEDPAVIKAIHDKIFGTNLKWIYSGGAALNPYYIRMFRALGVEILQGYGMSECSPVITSNGMTEHKDGTVGRPLANAQIRIVNGEIQVKGSSVMQGYYKMPEETAETLEDGWLHTGDEGNIDEEGYLTITGRTKNLIILSNGENVSPEMIEERFGMNPLISEIVITGEVNGLTARIYPDPDAVEAAGLLEEALRAKLQEAIDASNASEPSYRAITALVIRQNPFRKSTTHKILRRYAAEDQPLQ